MKSDDVIHWLEQERKRLARDVHDGPAQALTNASMRLEIMKKLLENQQTEFCISEIDRLQSILRTSINEVRRLIFDLRPSFLESGLQNALSLYSERFSQAYGIPVRVEGDWAGYQLPHTVEVALFRVFQEVLSNVYKHAQANQVRVTLAVSEKAFQLVVVDDGHGFESDLHSVTSFGLRGMKERMALINGTLRIDSKVGYGTMVIAEVPIAEDPTTEASLHE